MIKSLISTVPFFSATCHLSLKRKGRKGALEKGA
jgi:hypothetical protein